MAPRYHRRAAAYSDAPIEPANASVVIAAEPKDENRTLWVEADRGELFPRQRADAEWRKREAPAPFGVQESTRGPLTLRAEVRTQSDLRGLATRMIVARGEPRQASRPGHRNT